MPGPLGTGSGGGATGSVGTIGIPTTDGMIIGIKSAATGGLVGVQSAGTTVGNRATLNFSSGITVTDNAGSARVDVAPSFGTPGAVTGGATAASGSATTLARSDHVHSTASLPVLLASSVLGSNAAILSATSIPSGFSTLHIRWICPPTQRAGQATDAIVLRLNSDSGNNYRANASSQSYLVGMGVAGATGLAAPVISAGWVDIFGYASTNYYKQTGHTLYANADNVNYSVGQSSGGGIWLNTSAVTSVSFSSINGANLSTNTAIYVYGYP